MTLPTSEELQKVFHSTQRDSFEREQMGGISILGPSIHNLRGFSAVRDAILDALIVEAERLCQDDHNQIDIRLDSGSYETLADWLRSFKEEA